MRAPNAVAIISAALWLIATISGADLLNGVISRVGHAEPDQVMFGVGIPLLMVAAIAVCALVCNKVPRFGWVLSAVSVCSLFLFLGYCTYLGAGI